MNEQHSVEYRPTPRHAWRLAGHTLTESAARHWAEGLASDGRYARAMGPTPTGDYRSVFYPSDTHRSYAGEEALRVNAEGNNVQ